MTVQEIRELIGKKTEEINGYLESRDADKAEAALEEKRKLLYMVTEAEKELKSKTGRVKRSMVWEWLVERFPIISLFITEEKYDELLDQALDEFRKMLEGNDSLYDYVYNTLTVTEEDTEEDILRKTVEGA